MYNNKRQGGERVGPSTFIFTGLGYSSFTLPVMTRSSSSKRFVVLYRNISRNVFFCCCPLAFRSPAQNKKYIPGTYGHTFQAVVSGATAELGICCFVFGPVVVIFRPDGGSWRPIYALALLLLWLLVVSYNYVRICKRVFGVHNNTRVFFTLKEIMVLIST